MEKRRDRGAQSPPATLPDLLSQEEVEKKTDALMKEFLSVKDFKEARQCVLDLQSPGLHHVVVMQIINSVLDRKPADRTSAAILLASIAQDHILTNEHCQAG